MSTQPGVPTQKPRNKVFIQKLSDGTRKIFDELKKTGQKQTEACFFATKTIKIDPNALVADLEKFQNLCESTKLKRDIQGIMTEVKGLYHDGEVKKFVCHDSEDDGSKLEFVCAVVYMYKCEDEEAYKQCKQLLVCGSCKMCKACRNPITCNTCKRCKENSSCEEPIACGECNLCTRCQNFKPCRRCEECKKCKTPVACDYLLTTYSYKERVNRTGVAIGASTIAGGVIVGSLCLVLGIVTGGIGFTIGGAIAGAVAATGAGATGAVVITKSTDTTIKDYMKELLEGCFVYEIVERKYATLEDGQLYLQLEN